MYNELGLGDSTHIWNNFISGAFVAKIKCIFLLFDLSSCSVVELIFFMGQYAKNQKVNTKPLLNSQEMILMCRMFWGGNSVEKWYFVLGNRNAFFYPIFVISFTPAEFFYSLSNMRQVKNIEPPEFVILLTHIHISGKVHLNGEYLKN